LRGILQILDILLHALKLPVPEDDIEPDFLFLFRGGRLVHFPLELVPLLAPFFFSSGVGSAMALLLSIP
jgi:hypothetical protein